MQLLEAAPGAARRAVVEAWLERARRAGATAWRLPGDFRTGGVMAAVKSLLAALLPDLAGGRRSCWSGTGSTCAWCCPPCAGSSTPAGST